MKISFEGQINSAIPLQVGEEPDDVYGLTSKAGRGKFASKDHKGKQGATKQGGKKSKRGKTDVIMANKHSEKHNISRTSKGTLGKVKSRT